jgi:hypothetical protein
MLQEAGKELGQTSLPTSAKATFGKGSVLPLEKLIHPPEPQPGISELQTHPLTVINN